MRRDLKKTHVAAEESFKIKPYPLHREQMELFAKYKQKRVKPTPHNKKKK